MLLPLPRTVDSDIYAARVDDFCRVVFGPVGDYQASLSSSELEVVGKAVEKRKREFSTGRYFSSLALDALGAHERIVGISGRRPIWPKGFVGSISHSDVLAIVIVARRESNKSFGVDIERQLRVTPQMREQVLTAREIQMHSGTKGRDTVCFSAKESVYKSISPIAEGFVGFHDVEIEITGAESFNAKYIGSDDGKTRIDGGHGSYQFIGDHVITNFQIDLEP